MPKSAVLVIGGIHQSHEDAARYTYERMGGLFAALEPDIFCVEVKQRHVDDGSLEGMPFDFKKHMVPQARKLGVPIIGIDWWDGKRGTRWRELQKEASKDSSLQAELELHRNLFTALNAYFERRDFNEINSPAVTNLWAAKNAFKYEQLRHHPAYAEIVAFEQERNERMAQHVVDIVTNNPGKSVLVGVGIDHKYFIEKVLRERGIRVLHPSDLASI